MWVGQHSRTFMMMGTDKSNYKTKQRELDEFYQ